MPKTNNSGTTIKPAILFCIGISAGFIAAVLPRVTALLSAQQYNVDVELFSFDYIIVTVVFSLIIGVSMIWFYLGTKKAPRDLFVTALSLPAIISGSINMATTTNNGQEQIAQAMEQIKKKDKIVENLTKTLESLSNIETIPGESLDLGSNQPVQPSLFSQAFAADGDKVGTTTGFSPGVKYIPREEQAKVDEYVVVLRVDTDEEKVKQAFQRYQENQTDFTNLIIRKSSGRYYLIDNKRLPRSLAIMNAVKLKEKYQDLSPRIIKVK